MADNNNFYRLDKECQINAVNILIRVYINCTTFFAVSYSSNLSYTTMQFVYDNASGLYKYNYLLVATSLLSI